MSADELRRPRRVARMRLPERASLIGASVREADRDVVRGVTGPVLDTTHFDTVRFPPPPWALERFAQAARDGAVAYTPYRGSEAVLEQVARSVSGFLGVEVDPEREIVITPGTQAGLLLALSALVEAGDRVMRADPDYLFSERMLRFLDASIDHIPLTVGQAAPQLDLAAIEDALAQGARVLVLSHPNNPTGAVYDAGTIKRIAQLVAEADATVVVDELYSRLVYDETPFHHLVAEPGMRERCVTLLGPSKTESLTGYRLGVVVGPPDVIDDIEDLLAINSLRAPAYAQHVLLGWLTDDEAWLAERLVDLRQMREHTTRRLRELPFLRVEPQQGTAYLFPDVSELGLRDQEIAQRLLHDAGVLVNPGYQFGPRGVGSFRVCYARDEQQWDDALTRMLEVLEGLARASTPVHAR